MTTYTLTSQFSDQTYTVDVDDNGIVTAVTGDDQGVADAMLSTVQGFPYKGRFVMAIRSMWGPMKWLVQEADSEVGKMDQVVKIDVDEQLAFGWAYVTHRKDGTLAVDKSGEFIDDVTELEKSVYDYVVKCRVGGVDHTEDRQVGTLVESMVYTPEKMTKMGIPQGTLPTGWWVGFRVEDADVWQSVKQGRRLGFSIHGKARKATVE